MVLVVFLRLRLRLMVRLWMESRRTVRIGRLGLRVGLLGRYLFLFLLRVLLLRLFSLRSCCSVRGDKFDIFHRLVQQRNSMLEHACLLLRYTVLARYNYESDD